MCLNLQTVINTKPQPCLPSWTIPKKSVYNKRLFNIYKYQDSSQKSNQNIFLCYKMKPQGETFLKLI